MIRNWSMYSDILRFHLLITSVSSRGQFKFTDDH